MNTTTTADDQRSVNMICEENDSWDDPETDHAYDHSSDQEANSDFLFPGLNACKRQKKHQPLSSLNYLTQNLSWLSLTLE